MDFGYGVPVVRQRAARITDPYSDQADTLDWANPATETFDSCAFWQESSLDTAPVDQRRDQIVTVTVVVLPYGADIDRDDRFVVMGKTYNVVGEPDNVHHPMTGWEPGCVVRGTRADG